MESLSPLNVRFDPETRAWIKRMAHSLNWSENKVIRECVKYTRMVIEHPESTEVFKIVQLSQGLPKCEVEKSP